MLSVVLPRIAPKKPFEGKNYAVVMPVTNLHLFSLVYTCFFINRAISRGIFNARSASCSMGSPRGRSPASDGYRAREMLLRKTASLSVTSTAYPSFFAALLRSRMLCPGGGDVTVDDKVFQPINGS